MQVLDGSMDKGKCCIKQTTFMFGFFALVTIAIRLIHLSNLHTPFIWNDEMGYWSHAANLSGLEWNENVDLWYSYGYSLVLVPLFWLSHNMGSLYKMAIVINSVFGLISFGIAKLILDEIDDELDDRIKIVISFVATNYSAYLFQTEIAWSETCIYFVFWIVLWLSIRFFKKPNVFNSLIFTVALFYLYIVHNRTIVIMIAFVMTLGYMLWEKKINIKCLLIIFTIIAGMYLVNKGIKSILNEYVWNNNGGFVGNDISSQKGRLLSVFSISGILDLIKSLLGKIWYILVSTFLVAYGGVVYVICKLVDIFKSNRIKHKYFYVFVFLSIAGTFMVSAISWINIDAFDTRIDGYFYGRYTDMICGVLILFGLVALLKKDNKKDLVFVNFGLVLLLFCSLTVYKQVNDVENAWVNIPCAPGVLFIRDFNCIYLSIVSGIVFLVIYSVFSWNRKLTQYKRIMIVGIVSFSYFCISRENAYYACTKVWQENTMEFSELDTMLNRNADYKIYLPEGNDRSNEHFSLNQHIRANVVEGEIGYDSVDMIDAENAFLVMDLDNATELNLIENEEWTLVMTTNKENPVAVLAKGVELKRVLQEQGYVK